MEKARILVVEGEAAAAIRLQAALVRSGYEVTVVTTGEGAVRKAREMKPDLVITDIGLGASMDGLEVANQIRAFLNVLIVHVVGRRDLIATTRAADLIYNGCLVKPFTDDELAAVVTASLERHGKTVDRE